MRVECLVMENEVSGRVAIRCIALLDELAFMMIPVATQRRFCIGPRTVAERGPEVKTKKRDKHADARCGALDPTADVPGKATKTPVLCGIEKSVMSSTAKRNEEPRSVPYSKHLMQ